MLLVQLELVLVEKMVQFDKLRD